MADKHCKCPFIMQGLPCDASVAALYVSQGHGAPSHAVQLPPGRLVSLLCALCEFMNHTRVLNARKVVLS